MYTRKAYAGLAQTFAQRGSHHDYSRGTREAEPLDHPTNTNLVLVGQVLCILVPFVIWFMPLDVDPTIKHVLAIVGFMIIAWITQAVDYVLAGFIGCFLFWALGIVKFP